MRLRNVHRKIGNEARLQRDIDCGNILGNNGGWERQISHPRPCHVEREFRADYRLILFIGQDGPLGFPPHLKNSLAIPKTHGGLDDGSRCFGGSPCWTLE